MGVFNECIVSIVFYYIVLTKLTAILKPIPLPRESSGVPIFMVRRPIEKLPELEDIPSIIPFSQAEQSAHNRLAKLAKVTYKM